MSTDQPTFATADIRHACFLLALGFALLGTDRSNGRVKFLVACSPREAEKYFSGDDHVSATRLFQAWKRLRDIIDQDRGASPSNTNRSHAHGHAPR